MITMQINTEFNDVLSLISHEMKSPIALIKANLELLKVTNYSADDNSFDMIFKELDNLEKMSLSLINTLKNENTKEKVFIVDLIEEILEPYANIHKNINFTICCDDEDLHIIGSNYHIEVLINNLIKNAVEAISEKNEYQHTDESFINVNISSSLNKIKIEVVDNGIGLNTESCKNYDDKFYTSKKNGSGLGLSIVKYILNLYNGSLSIKNNIHGGCTATVNL